MSGASHLLLSLIIACASSTSIGCYIRRDGITWVDAQASCISRGGHLTFIKNAFDQAAYTKLAGALCGNSDGDVMWLGASANITSPDWTWTDGTPLSYSNWAKGQPWQYSRSASCMFMTLDSMNWYGGDCNAENPGVTYLHSTCYFCQFPANGVQRTCASGLLPGANGCYSPSGSDVWTGANLQCQTQGGTLPIVRNALENSDLLNVSRVVVCSGEDIWLGATRLFEQAWQWIDGTPLTYSNWANGNPDDDPAKACLLLRTSDGAWYNNHCDSGAGVICPLL